MLRSAAALYAFNRVVERAHRRWTARVAIFFAPRDIARLIHLSKPVTCEAQSGFTDQRKRASYAESSNPVGIVSGAESCSMPNKSAQAFSIMTCVLNQPSSQAMPMSYTVRHVSWAVFSTAQSVYISEFGITTRRPS